MAYEQHEFNSNLALYNKYKQIIDEISEMLKTSTDEFLTERNAELMQFINSSYNKFLIQARLRIKLLEEDKNIAELELIEKEVEDYKNHIHKAQQKLYSVIEKNNQTNI